MDAANETPEIVNNERAKRFEAHIGDAIGILTYRRSGSTIAYMHTEVPEALQGHGIAGKLAAHALTYARENGLDVVPLCPYVAKYIKDHPEFADLVAPRARWREFLPARGAK